MSIYTGSIAYAAVGDTGDSGGISALSDEQPTITTQVTARSDYNSFLGGYGDNFIGIIWTSELEVPDGETVEYQWYRDSSTQTYQFTASSAEDIANFDTEHIPSTATPIIGANSNTYTVSPEDVGSYIFLVVKGTGSTVYCSRTSSQKVIHYLNDLTIDGTLEVGQTLTINTSYNDYLTDEDVSYQWYKRNPNNYKDYEISGATSKEYIITNDDIGYILGCKITEKNDSGWRNSSGICSSSSAVSGDYVAKNISGVSITGYESTQKIGDTLEVQVTADGYSGNVPSEYLTYQWYRNTEKLTHTYSIPSTATKIDNATSPTYTLTNDDAGRYLFVVVTANGSGGFTGSDLWGETSDRTALKITEIAKLYTGDTEVVENDIVDVNTVITSELDIPEGETVEYQWYRGTASSMIISNSFQYTRFDTLYLDNAEPITGANSSTYTTRPEDIGNYVFLVVKGTGDTLYACITENFRVKCTVDDMKIEGTYKVGDTLTVTSKYDEYFEDGDISYQWYRFPTFNAAGLYKDWYKLDGETSKEYIMKETDIGMYIHCEVISNNTNKFDVTPSYNDNVFQQSMISSSEVVQAADEDTGDEDDKTLKSANITGTLKSGEILSVSTDPSEATVYVYWYRDNSKYGDMDPDYETTLVSYNTPTYTLTDSDVGYYIRAEVKGNGEYSGTVEDVTDEVVAEADEEKGAITSASWVNNWSYLTPGRVLTVKVEPSDAEYTVTWSKISGPYNNTTGPQIDVGNNTNTLTVTDDLLGYYIVAKVEGINGWTGSKIIRTNNKVATQIYASWVDNCNTDTEVGDNLSVNITPEGATYNIKWQKSTSASYSYYDMIDIQGSDGKDSLTVTEDLEGYYIWAIIQGNGDYTGYWTLSTTQVQAASTDEPEQPDDTPSVTPGERIPTSDESVEYVTIDTDDVYNGYEQGVKVYVSQGQDIAIRLPFKTVLDGTKGSENKADFEVEVRANISGADNIKVIPETSFTMAATGKKPINGTVEIDQTEYNIAKDGEDSLSTGKVVAGKVSVENLSAGHWEGDFDWEISIEGLQVADSGENTEVTV